MRSRIVLAVVLLSLPGILQAQKPGSKLDDWGNPIGKDLGLAADGEFQGKRLLVWTAGECAVKGMYPWENPLWDALKAKGFDVQLRRGPFDRTWLYDADQLWIIANSSPGMTDTDYDHVVQYVKRGNGVYMLADNEPFIVEANALAQRLFGSSVVGNDTGKAIIVTRGGHMTQDDLLKYQQMLGFRRRRTSEPGSPLSRTASWIPRGLDHIAAPNGATYRGEAHALLTGVNYLWEGVSISHIVPTEKLEVVLSASDGQALVAVSRDPKQRVVIDCGCTRYYMPQHVIPAGQIRFAENVAAYLMGKDAKR